MSGAFRSDAGCLSCFAEYETYITMRKHGKSVIDALIRVLQEDDLTLTKCLQNCLNSYPNIRINGRRGHTSLCASEIWLFLGPQVLPPARCSQIIETARANGKEPLVFCASSSSMSEWPVRRLSIPVRPRSAPPSHRGGVRHSLTKK